MTDWIPVSERLPKKTGVYFCAFKSGGVWLMFYSRIDSSWEDYDKEIPTDAVTHWMPLPEPPK